MFAAFENIVDFDISVADVIFMTFLQRSAEVYSDFSEFFRGNLSIFQILPQRLQIFHINQDSQAALPRNGHDLSLVYPDNVLLFLHGPDHLNLFEAVFRLFAEISVQTIRSDLRVGSPVQIRIICRYLNDFDRNLPSGLCLIRACFRCRQINRRGRSFPQLMGNFICRNDVLK